MATFSVINEKEAPKRVSAGTNASKRRQAEYDSYLKVLKKGQVGKLAPGSGETARSVALRISRAAGRASIASETWIVDGVVYFRVG